MNKSSFIQLTQDYVINNFDNLLGKQVELDIIGKTMTVIIQEKNADGDTCGYTKSDGKTFLCKMGDEVMTIELNSAIYKPGTVKINTQTLQGGRKRSQQKRSEKTSKYKYTYFMDDTSKYNWNNTDGTNFVFKWYNGVYLADGEKIEDFNPAVDDAKDKYVYTRFVRNENGEMPSKYDWNNSDATNFVFKWYDESGAFLADGEKREDFNPFLAKEFLHNDGYGYGYGYYSSFEKSDRDIIGATNTRLLIDGEEINL